MKKKKRKLSPVQSFIIIADLLIVCAIGLFVLYKIVLNPAAGKLEDLEHKTVKAQEAFQFIDEDIAVEEDSDISLYYDNVEFEVVEIDTDDMVGTAKITTPDIPELLEDVIDDVDIEPDMSYEDIYDEVKKEFYERLEDGDYDDIVAEVEMQIAETQDGYMLVPNDELHKALSSDVFDALLSSNN